MNKKKIILLIILLIITIGLTGLLIYRKTVDKENTKDEEKIIQTNERDESVLQVEIINDEINIRKENDSKSEALGKVYKGEIYTVLDSKEDEYYHWYQIETKNGIKGFIAGKYLEEDYVKKLEPKEEVIE